MQSDPNTRTVIAGLLAWVLPGAGHFWLGRRGLAAVFFVAITLPYMAGAAIGGVKYSVNPVTNRWLFLAELGVGGYTSAFFALSATLPTTPVSEPSPYMSYYPETEVATIYLAVAGLLNVLAILDALMRAQIDQPLFHHELAAGEKPAAGAVT